MELSIKKSFHKGGIRIKVRLTPFSDNWSQMFQDEVQFLKAIFGNVIIRFDHFGSTSVSRLKAKPVIDIDYSSEKNIREGNGATSTPLVCEQSEELISNLG